MDKVQVYDTTLRDGNQAEGVSFSVHDKVLIAQRLDEIGVDYIEGGWPNEGNPRDQDFFRAIRDVPLQHAIMTAFGSTRRGSVAPEEDANLRFLLEAETPAVALFGKTWALHATEVLRVSLEENLRMIEDSVAYLAAHGREVIYDAEHFFDGFAADSEYALETLGAALRGGARTIVLCDTNGGTMPLRAAEAISAVREHLGAEADGLTLGIHAHNDAGMAAATSQIAVELGCRQVQGTINGYGERCGNANLCTLIPNLELKGGFQCLPEGRLGQLTELSRFVSELTNLPHDERQPYVGGSAFAHKGGTHVDAVRKVPASFEHVLPESVGNTRRFLLSDQAGGSTIVSKMVRLRPDLDKRSPEVRAILSEVKELENQGYQFEAAEASFELLAEKALGTRRHLWDTLDYRVVVQRHTDGRVSADASVRVQVNGVEIWEAAEGNGPINALDQALRKALASRYPELANIELADYKVRVLDAHAGTRAAVRVLIRSTDGEAEWGTVGADENVIEASWQALTDSVEYGLRRARQRQQEPQA